MTICFPPTIRQHLVSYVHTLTKGLPRYTHRPYRRQKLPCIAPYAPEIRDDTGTNRGCLSRFPFFCVCLCVCVFSKRKRRLWASSWKGCVLPWTACCSSLSNGAGSRWPTRKRRRRCEPIRRAHVCTFGFRRALIPRSMAFRLLTVEAWPCSTLFAHTLFLA